MDSGTPAASQADGQTFVAETGRYVGRRENGVVRVLGVRYASARRFRPPVPVEPGHGTIRADVPAPACPQPPSPGDALLGAPYAGVRFDEDCQRLSLTVPADARPGDRLPVMVWIHGGSYVSGAGDLPIFDPAALVREHSVIVVAVTYRLGVLGFLGDGRSLPANLGLLDQIEALRWISTNIAAFGGDPANVTLFGHSSGGDAIAHLMISEGTRDLFRRAIIQSAPFGLQGRRTRMLRRMAQAAGPLDEGTPLDGLLSAQARAEASVRRCGYRAGMPFSPQYGHAPLPPERDVPAAWREGARAFDVLVGWTTEETSLFASLSPALRRLFALPRIGRAFRRAALRVTTDRVYRRHGKRFARLMAGAGARVTEYEVGWRPPGGRLGAAHTVELPLLFPGPAWRGAEILGGVDDRDLLAVGTELRRLWAHFARHGEIPAAMPVAREPLVVLRPLS